MISGIMPSKKWKAKELIKAHNGKPYFEPGTDWRYSNANYFILSLIIEKITGKSLAENFQKLIFNPLELTESFYHFKFDKDSRLLSGYDRALMPFPNVHGPRQTSWSSLAVGSGAMVSSAYDMAHFMRALLDGKIISKDSLNLMQQFIPAKNAGESWTDYGLGLVKGKIAKEEYLGHEGLFIGFQSFVFYSLEKQYIIALAANKSKYDQD